MRCPTTRPTAAWHRRGLTLVELLVTIALMLLIMSVIVGVFTAATDAMTGMRKDQELASITRRLETLIQQDLQGATARFTPPLNPADNLGYFEYGENSFADAQGEDTDDYLAFTTKAPPGQPFTGRVMLPRGNYPAGPFVFEPATITAENAEVIYFLRHGNLYRRVLLVAPNQRLYRMPDPTIEGFPIGGQLVGWQGANDISVRPSDSNDPINAEPPIANSLGDLTNRHNRFARPRFTDDINGDGAADDFNLDSLADYYPTLTRNYLQNLAPALRPRPLDNNQDTFDSLAFPFVFPAAYSYGQVEYRDAQSVTSAINFGPTRLPNHSPLDLGDNLVGPPPPPPDPDVLNPNGWTFWGFPTWSETRSPNWTAANKRLAFQEFGIPAMQQAYGLSWQRGSDRLPRQFHWYSDRVGAATLVPPGPSWQDDLIATNVRSFDVKALDPNASFYSNFIGSNFTSGYYDLGYANNVAGTNPNGEVFTFGHEGRIPPLPSDNRIDYQMEQKFGASASNPLDLARYNLGDPNANTVRLRRVWDTWSTDYAFAPLKGIDPTLYPPLNNTRPAYPSYPPPYPEPLRGIQIQIRIASPDNQMLKVITIRHDFTDKL